MKKTLLATALVAGFAGAAHAESSVTLYGLVDVGYGFQQNDIDYKYAGGKESLDKERLGAINNVANGSRWGLKGKEDLGNGTSAIFTLEGGFTPGDGKSAQGGRLFGRQAFVGLTGDSWGTFTIGRQYNLGDTFTAPIDPFGTSWGYASATNVFGDGLSDRHDAMIKYMTPNFNGFQLGLGVFHTDEETTTTQTGAATVKEEKRDSGVSVGLGYTAGALYIGASYDLLDAETKVSGLRTRDEESQNWNIGMTYDFDVAKLHLMYGGTKDGFAGDMVDVMSNAVGWVNGYTGDGYEQHAWLVGLSAPVGDAGKVMFSYTGSTHENDDVRNPGNNLVSAKADGDTHNFALGYRHSLSKRTSVYGVASYGFGEIKFDNGTHRDKVELDRAQAIIGLQHRF